jgi:catechol 2,3-dioxygenase-like lactoylglutathione lyase family enzyme
MTDVDYLNGRLHQVALVIPDLAAAMRDYWQRLGVGPWAIFTFASPPVREMTYRGRSQPYSMRLAFARWGDVQLELIQPLEGPSIYHEFLAANPAGGLHHLGLLVSDLEAAIGEMAARGYPMIQSGRGTGIQGDGGYAYFETDGAGLAAIIELIELPKERRAPEATYPAAPG